MVSRDWVNDCLVLSMLEVVEVALDLSVPKAATAWMDFSKDFMKDFVNHSLTRFPTNCESGCVIDLVSHFGNDLPTDCGICRLMNCLPLRGMMMVVVVILPRGLAEVIAG